MRTGRLLARVALVAVVAATVPCAGCGRFGYAELPPDGGPPFDAGFDAALALDLGVDAPSDAPFDASSDAPSDASSDASMSPDGGRCPAPSVEPACTSLRAIPDVPVIDGVVECGLALVPLVPQGWTAVEPLPSGHSAELAIAWHPEGVYFFVHVLSPTVRPPGATDPAYCGDTAEVYVDADGAFAAAPSYDSPGTRQFIIPAPAGTTSTRAVGYVNSGPPVSWSAGRAIAVRTADGYVVEAFVTREDVLLARGMLVSGDRVGIDVSVNVAAPVDASGSCGRRLGQYFLRAVNTMTPPPSTPCDGLPWCDVAAFCAPALLPSGG